MLFDRAFQSSQWVMGLMSGTSADGVDGALLRISKSGIVEFGATLYRPYSHKMQQRILAAMGKKPFSDDQLVRDITDEHIVLASDLIKQSGVMPILIGFHGQTMYHIPRKVNQDAETLQVGDAARLAHQLNVPAVAQFRIQDVAAGGEGAPLVPIFHQALLEAKPLISQTTSAVVNIGGVCNVTFFDPGGELKAGDVGPGCCLLDDWMHQQSPALTYEALSQLAERGKPSENLLNKWIASFFFKQPLPKSADRLQWHTSLKDVLGMPAPDATATLASFTVRALVDVLPPYVQTLYMAGGGRHHTCLMTWLARHYDVVDIQQLGCSGDFVEAYAFALLAMRSVLGLPLSFAGTTGVPRPTSGGELYLP